ncbi:MAG: SDR family NAD(P)-dependent oxidoreductase [Phycisphaerales bacterium]|nr:SDR family NAD(P)-dependent oxidoreductase [Phycisphaerales bacterium]
MTRLPAKIVDNLRPRIGGQSVCVTGGAGFIGGHLVDTLISLGARVAVLDDLSNSTPAHIASLMDLEPDRIRFIQGSILDPSALGEAIDGAAVVFHLAAVSSVPLSIEDPDRTWVVNATGTMRVLKAASKAGVNRVVYSASSSAYGDSPELPKIESMAPEPMSPYAAAKHAGESLCRSWSGSYGLDTACLRYFNIFGPRQAADSAYAAVIPAFVTKFLSNESPTIFDDGEQTRDFTHVSNAVLANLLAATHAEPINGQVVNIGAGVRTTINELVTRIQGILGVEHIAPEHQPVRVGEVRDSVADISAAQRVIGYTPVTDLGIGLKATVDWYASQFRDHADAGADTGQDSGS